MHIPCCWARFDLVVLCHERLAGGCAGSTMGQGQRTGINLDGQPYQAKRPGRAGRLYLDGPECQLDGMANERVAEKCPLAEGRQVSWSLRRGLAPRKPGTTGTTARAVHHRGRTA